MTTTCDLLTPEQKEQYLRDGYCVVADLYTTAEIDEIEKFFEDTKAEDRPWFDQGKKQNEVDKTKSQVRAMHPHRYDEKPKAWVTNARVAAVLEELLDKPALVAQTMYYFKPPGARGQGMHQDNIYLLSEPATCIAAWTAIDAADIDNGCLWVVPGSNHGDILCPEKGTAREAIWLEYGDTNITRFPRETKPVAVPVPRGSTMFFNGNLIHGSGPNRTKDRSRRTFIGHYIDEASVQVSRFYHPILNMEGEVVSVPAANGGGPCGDGWQGAVH
jgi:phytanoyl-CoA hydroxylase